MAQALQALLYPLRHNADKAETNSVGVADGE